MTRVVVAIMRYSGTVDSMSRLYVQNKPEKNQKYTVERDIEIEVLKK